MLKNTFLEPICHEAVGLACCKCITEMTLPKSVYLFFNSAYCTLSAEHLGVGLHCHRQGTPHPLHRDLSPTEHFHILNADLVEYVARYSPVDNRSYHRKSENMKDEQGKKV